MPTLNDYFSDDRIISHLCKERLKLAESRNDRQYISRLAGSSTQQTPDHDHEFYHLLPARRKWSAYRPRNRRAGLNPDRIALKNAVMALRDRAEEQQWAGELNHYIAAVRDRVFTSHPITFAPPLVRWEVKKKGGHEYRALCRFDPTDNLILCLYAQYLRDTFDPQFSPSSYAFRARNSQGKLPTHHQAFTEVYNLKHSEPDRDLYVAEADIQGFFDTVDHEVALTTFRRAAQKVNLHPRAEVIFRAYLNCYSFPLNVLADTSPRLRERDSKGYFKWPEKELRHIHKADPRNLRIGVSQGGAVSGIIANLILDAADKSVEAECKSLGSEIHYYRYCDDMLLISPNLKDCKAAFQAYLNKLTELKLAFHRPESTCIYGKKHWGHKSKVPYRWSGRQWFGSVPWVQFVGYQIRYDGLVRPRKGSVANERAKLIKTTGKIIYGLIEASGRNRILANRTQVRESLKSRLTAQGVGRVKGGESGPRPMCWASGFQALHNKPFISTSLRRFDKTRAAQIGRIGSAPILYGMGRRSRGGAGRRDLTGYAFSYHAQFTNLGGRNLVLAYWRPGNLKDRLKARLFNLVREARDWYDSYKTKIGVGIRFDYRS